MNKLSVAQPMVVKNVQERIPGLDALRGMAAIGVVVLHYHMYFDAGPDWLILYPAYKGAEFFVDLFFVLSGFLLTQVYADVTSYRELVIRRFARLFPLQWLTLIIVLAGQNFYQQAWGKAFIYQINDAYHFLLNVLLLQQTGLQKGFSFNGPSWSISVEWLVNLLFFFFLQRKWLLLRSAFIFALGGGLLLASSQPSITHFGLSFGVIDASLLRVLFGFNIGVIAAIVFQRSHAELIGAKQWDLIALLFGAVLILFLGNKNVNHIPSIQLIVVGLVMPVLVIACAKGPRAGWILSARPLVWLGDISYAVYLMHFPVLIAVFGFRDHLPFHLNSGEGMMIVLACVMLVSHVVFHYYERPAQRLFRKTLRKIAF